jgi:hypothetical protein
MVTACTALAETRVYVGPAGGPSVYDVDRDYGGRHGWDGRQDGRYDGRHDGYRHSPPPMVVIRERDRDADVAAGVMGFLGGIVVGSALDNNGRIPVVRQYRDGYEQPRQLLRPWSASWYRWCEARYRSFDPGSGTYRDHSGRVKFCEARG